MRFPGREQPQHAPDHREHARASGSGRWCRGVRGRPRAEPPPPTGDRSPRGRTAGASARHFGDVAHNVKDSLAFRSWRSSPNRPGVRSWIPGENVIADGDVVDRPSTSVWAYCVPLGAGKVSSRTTVMIRSRLLDPPPGGVGGGELGSRRWGVEVEVEVAVTIVPVVTVRRGRGGRPRGTAAGGEGVAAGEVARMGVGGWWAGATVGAGVAGGRPPWGPAAGGPPSRRRRPSGV